MEGVTLGLECRNCRKQLAIPTFSGHTAPRAPVDLATALLWIGKVVSASGKPEIQRIACESCLRMYGYTLDDVFIQLPEFATKETPEEA